MKRLKLIVACLVAMIALGSTQTFAKKKNPKTPYGKLAVEGAQLVGENGEAVQLKGVSFGWHCMATRFYNRSTVRELVNDWGANIVRCAIGMDNKFTEGDPEFTHAFDYEPELGYALVDSIVRGAVENGVYVIIDFHSHRNNLETAKQFFAKVSKKYGKLENVLFEVWNEPLKIEWSECKQYAETLIPIIRKNAPNSIIIVGTPTWSQDVHLAAADPIVGQKNIMYTLHFYAATHKQYLRDRMEQVIEKGLPVFITECGGMTADGDGYLDPDEWKAWIDVANKHKVSWLAWSIHDKNEVCSFIKPTASSFGEQWTSGDLKPWADMVIKTLHVAPN